MKKEYLGEHPVTTAPVSNATANALHDPEFLDAPGIQQRFGIKRGLAYQLLAAGKIKGVSLRRRGTNRGKRLFSVHSIRSFLSSQMQ